MIDSIFVSSPGDLADLRAGIAADLRNWLDEHGLSHLLKPYLWEADQKDGLLSARIGVQSQIPDPAETDVPLTICFFGERCGSSLNDECDRYLNARFDGWRASGDGPGFLHPWPTTRAEQDHALACGQYPLTGTVYELLSAHAHAEDADNLIVGCCIDRNVLPTTTASEVVLNGGKLYSYLTDGVSRVEKARIDYEVYDPQAAALLNVLKHHAAKVRPIDVYKDDAEMRRGLFKLAEIKLREKLGISSLHNPFKQSLEHWAVSDQKPLPGRSDDVKKLVEAMHHQGTFMLLRGRSGCGKSSLMQRGVMARLRELDGSIPVPFRPTELMAGAGEGDPLDRLAQLIAENASVPFAPGGPNATRPSSYATRLRAALDSNHVRIVIGFDQFEEIIDEMQLESEKSSGATRGSWWLVIKFLNVLCSSPNVRLIATLESAREQSFLELDIAGTIGLEAKTRNVDATDDTVGDIAANGFRLGGLPLSPEVIEEIKRKWRIFEQETAQSHASPLPLACLFFHRLYERFSDQAGTTKDERRQKAFLDAASDDDRRLTLEEIGGQDAIAFADIVEDLANEAWRASGRSGMFLEKVEDSEDFIHLNNFLKTLVTVDHQGNAQLRSVVESVGHTTALRLRTEFRAARLLVRIPCEGPTQLRPVHQAFFDRWTPARRWLAYRKQYLKIAQRFRDEAILRHHLGEAMPLRDDGSTLKAAAIILQESADLWRDTGLPLPSPDEAVVRDQALAVFDTALDPRAVIDGTLTQVTYIELAARYHRVELLKRFADHDPTCLHYVDSQGNTLLAESAWVDGPAVSYLLGQDVPHTTADANYGAVYIAVWEMQDDNFDKLATCIAPDDIIERSTGARVLHAAAWQGNEHVLEYLLNHEADLNAVDLYQRTALHIAAQKDHVGFFTRLLPSIDLQIWDEWGETALCKAANFGSSRVMDAYLKVEADEAQLTAVLGARNKSGDTPLMCTARARQPDTLRLLIQPELQGLGDPSSEKHCSENGDTLFHLVFRSVESVSPTQADRFRAREAIQVLLKDGRLHPNLKNNAGETPFDLGSAFPEARRALREDERVPRDYETMTPAMRIEDLSSPRPAIVLRLLNESPQALTDTHQKQPDSTSTLPSSPRAKSDNAKDEKRGETGLGILVRLKNHAVLTKLVDDDAHWPRLEEGLAQLLEVAAIPQAHQLRAALARRIDADQLNADRAGDVLGACIDAGDLETAKALAAQGAIPTLLPDAHGMTALHRAAIVGDIDRFRSILGVAPFRLPRDNWSRCPSDLAPDSMADDFRELETDMSDAIGIYASIAVPMPIDDYPPFHILERRDSARQPTEAERASVLAKWPDDYPPAESLGMQAFDLPFYSCVPLIEMLPAAESESSGRLCFLVNGDKRFRLNGTSPPIHEVNAKYTAYINEDTVLNYLAYFCFFVRGEDGPFLIVDQIQNMFIPDLGERTDNLARAFRAPRVWGRDVDDYWRVSALVYYSNAIFFCDFLVQPTGMIEMLNDTDVLTDLPARIDAPVELKRPPD